MRRAITVLSPSLAKLSVAALAATLLLSSARSEASAGGSLVDGYVFCDRNENGTRDDGEPGIPGVQVQVVGTETGTQLVTTDGDGHWLFDMTDHGGTFTISVPDGQAILASGNPTTDPSYTFTRVGQELPSVDFGFSGVCDEPVHSLSGRVFCDANCNGVDDGDAGLAGVDILITRTDVVPNVTFAAVTDALGNWSRTDLPAGSYEVSVPDGQAAIGVRPPTTPEPLDATLSSGNDVSGLEFGFCCPAQGPCEEKPYVVVKADGSGGVLITFQQSRAVNDNSYGTGCVGWGSRIHKFADLTGSDKLEVKVTTATATLLDCYFDYISAKTGAPSGYDTLGVTGGDGSITVGQAAWILPDSTTSYAKDLNTLGYFSGGVQTVGTSVANLLVNSPPTVSSSSYTPAAGSPFGAWDFSDTYYIHVAAAAFGSGGYNPSIHTLSFPLIHNSPAKTCPTSGGGGGTFSIKAALTAKDRDVKVSLANTGGNVTITKITITWPTSDGKLQSVKLDSKVLYDNPPISPTSATISTFKGSVGDRTIGTNKTKTLDFHFEKNVAATGYSVTVEFGAAGSITIP